MLWCVQCLGLMIYSDVASFQPVFKRTSRTPIITGSDGGRERRREKNIWWGFIFLDAAAEQIPKPQAALAGKFHLPSNICSSDSRSCASNSAVCFSCLFFFPSSSPGHHQQEAVLAAEEEAEPLGLH